MSEKKNGAPASVVVQDQNSVCIPFRLLLINPDVNVRQTYDEDWIKTLAEQLQANVTESNPSGLKRPLDVAAPNAKGEYELLAGFTRCKSLQLIHGKAVGDLMVRVNVHRSKMAGKALTPEEKMQINLASDEAQLDVKRSELAERVSYMVKEMGIKQDFVAKKCFVDPSTVSQLVRVWTKLAPDIRAAWVKAPSRSAEIPLATLVSWVQYPIDQQLIAFKKYMASPEELENDMREEGDEEGDDVEGTGDGERTKAKPEILWKLRTKKEFKERLEALLTLKKESPKEITKEQEVSIKELRWALSDLQKAPY